MMTRMEVQRALVRRSSMVLFAGLVLVGCGPTTAGGGGTSGSPGETASSSSGGSATTTSSSSSSSASSASSSGAASSSSGGQTASSSSSSGPPPAPPPPALARLLLTDAPADAADAVYVNVVETRLQFVPAGPAGTGDMDGGADAGTGGLGGAGGMSGVGGAGGMSGVGGAGGAGGAGELDGGAGDGGLPALDPGGWVSVGAGYTSYDLLALQNGLTALLGDANLGAGTVTGIRLVLDEADPGSIVIAGVPSPLKVPSGSQSGLKLQGNITLTPGEVTSITIDFDASKSIVKAGNQYLLKPVLHIASVASSPIED